MKQKQSVIVCKQLPKHIAALTLYPFIIYKDASFAEDAILVNHERIHLKQQLELLILPFYLWYGIEFLIRLLYLRNRKKAYRAISFEQEAYKNEANLAYLKQRKTYAFFQYMRNQKL
ncbi:hypothetical protein M2306_000616 [Myroides gitamensis]|uniref:Peptidase M56 domain-containing protein n=1 Tax=Myroides odoratus TaxID=256 RepID=A0A378RLM0_MYROD|nr:hypothetical protein [Myroides odoratus]MCS4237854.1 hypothetical protein [Myroides odoratus]MDH6599922.1 hypothetical protein [Myroides gitamensis]QQU04646.1 hypothetical protein I6I89_04980 [Myroides odoratus]STZ27916.1 Uncharacterised protein [Myroides odoratus]